ncbi:MAG TPA: O-antigen ligase family protein [Puia sp.]|nr:O-antigen ligase family protein [Puia sp.]
MSSELAISQYEAPSVRLDQSLLVFVLVGAFFAVTAATMQAQSVRSAIMGTSIIAALGFVLVTTAKDQLTITQMFRGAPKLLYIYIAAMVLADIASGGAGAHLTTFVAQMIATYLFYFMIPRALIRDGRRLELVFEVFTGLAAFAAVTAFLPLLGFSTFLSLPFAVKDAYSHFSGWSASGGIIETPLVLGTFMMLATTITFYRYRQFPSRQRIAAIALFLAALIVCQSRGSMLGLGVAAVAYFSPRWLISTGWRLLILVPLIAALAGAVLLLFLYVPALSSYFRVANGSSGRVVEWASLVLMTMKSPWVGYGVGTAGDFVAGLAPVLKGLAGISVSAVDGTYFETAFDSGLIVTFIYIALFLLPVWSVAQSQMPLNEKRFFVAVGLGIFVTNIWVSNNFGGMRLTSVMITILMGLAYQYARNSRMLTPPEVSS